MCIATSAERPSAQLSFFPHQHQFVVAFFPSDLADRTRHGPYNCVSGEKQ